MIESIVTQSEFRFVLGLILSILVGFIIGFERESKGKDAGISTHTLVILGSMLFTYISVNAPGSDSSTRIAAQVVTGIGFLGAGLILREGTNVRNLTTAASLWFAAAIGMAIGFEYYLVAIISGIVAVMILRIPHMSTNGLRNTPN